MGGRGASSGNSYRLYKKDLKYGEEFKTLLWIDNIKFVKFQLADVAKIPTETMSFGKNRIYVILNRKKELKSIATYNKIGLIERQIDLDHDHGKGCPHIHAWVDGVRIDDHITNKDIKIYERVINIWKQGSKLIKKMY